MTGPVHFVTKGQPGATRVRRTRRLGAAGTGFRAAGLSVVAALVVTGLVMGGLAPEVLVSPAQAAGGDGKDEATVAFLGQKITPRLGTYVVTKDLNVRAEPDTGGKKVASFAEGEKISVVGKAKGSWLAVRADGKDLGFVYAPVLMPLLDVIVKDPMTGRVDIAGGGCDYRIVFEGENPIEGQLFNSIDYRATLECQRDGAGFAFEMPLFITEGPYNGGSRPVHQIGMDVLELAQEYERVFSTNLLYDAEKGEVRLDNVSVDKYVTNGKKASTAKADGVAGAMAAAIGVAARSWSPAFWTDLSRALRGSTH